MAINPAAFTDISGVVSDLFASSAAGAKAAGLLGQARAAEIAGQSDVLKSQGDILEGQQYGEAAGLADLNARYTAQSTAIQTAQADRQLFGVLGGERAAVAASGFGEGGSAGDILRSSASQGALNRAVLGQQGLITEAGFQEQAQSYRTMQSAATLASQEDILASQREEIAAGGYRSAAAAESEAGTGDIISGILKGVAGVASLLEGNPAPLIADASNWNTSLPAGSFDGSGAF